MAEEPTSASSGGAEGQGEGPVSERMAVLRLLEQGKINAAEAADLLKALRDGDGDGDQGQGAGEYVARGADWVEQAARRAAERAQRMAMRGRRGAEFWARHADDIAAKAAEQAARAAEQIGENVGRIFSNLPDFMDRAARAGWGAWGPGFKFEETVEGDLEGEGGPGGLDMEAWNGPVRLHAVDGNHVRIILRKSVHAAGEDAAREIAAGVTATVSGRQVTVRRGEGAPGWPGGLALEAFLPRDAVWGGLVRTGNGAVEADGLSLRGLRLETSNGRVGLMGCIGQDVAIVTSNGRIDAEGLRGHTELRTSNGSISLAPPAGDGESDVSVVTSNGSIDIHVPAGVAVDVDATTSNGKIETSGLSTANAPGVQGSGRMELRWRSPEWDACAARVKLNLRTSNGGIRFR